MPVLIFVVERGVGVNESTSLALSNSVDNSKWRVNCDEETKAQRERRPTQSITAEDIKAAEQQIKNRSNKLPSLSIQDDMTEMNRDEIRRIGSCFTSREDVPTIMANDSLNLVDS
ncbi:unnamed protein product [Adineta steineri]|uniref:Uncharacterized protein n=1 Tax=Adineta steineri TaxID=433720 RepID=A0A813S257_9BILA|nr:unnamed protein product [Adineta steineri]